MGIEILLYTLTLIDNNNINNFMHYCVVLSLGMSVSWLLVKIEKYRKLLEEEKEIENELTLTK